MRPTASLRWRAAAAGCLVFLVLLYARQNSQTGAALDYLKAALAACEQNGESVVAKLKVVHQHKVKIDELYRRTVNDSKRGTQVLKESLSRCELNHLSAKERLAACEQAAAAHTVSQQNTVAGREEGAEGDKEGRAGREGRQVDKPIGGEQQRIEELQRRAAELEKSLNETRALLEAERRESGVLKKRVEECEAQLVAHVGAVPKAGYSANASAHFERVHDKDANLEFARDGDEAAAPIAPLMPARELVRRLEERNRKKEGGKEEEGEEEKHPQDRDQNDDYVAEKPNAAEVDYKEQEH
ncbi:hypothetical protein PFISCL1PPCAC_7618 [Pristionchus fissidentatus]|uniref:Uncharacterized protein n=1 Tax=Pristionchus fissidentatus TaxID=1538716 RepID=A0AAV5V9L2_9BILA|nr:hypothetical protein PFISCL1PPCAC_7618 [Pristionchus fissidentatus]